MTQISNNPVLDHIVILVSSEFLAHPPLWLTDSLTVIPGGTHSDGRTSNKLVVFDDGVYIELIAFAAGIDPADKATHVWGSKAEGQIVDWACTFLQRDSSATPEDQFAPLQQRVRGANTGFAYSDPWALGRTTPDGVELKWAISSPSVDNKPESQNPKKLSVTGGELPFWCLDRSPRAWRVPHADKANRTHPSGVVGVASVSVSVKGSDEVAHLRRAYDAVAGHEGKLVAVEGVDSAYSWKIDVPFSAKEEGENGRSGQADLALRKWSEESLDLKTLTSDSLHISLALLTKGRAGRIEGDLGKGRKLVVDLVPLA